MVDELGGFEDELESDAGDDFSPLADFSDPDFSEPDAFSDEPLCRTVAPPPFPISIALNGQRAAQSPQPLHLPASMAATDSPFHMSFAP